MSEITYSRCGDYLLPDLLPPTGNFEVGRFGRMHCKYLRQHRKIIYTNLLTSGKLNEHLHDIDTQTQEMFERLANEYAEWQGVTERLKAENQMEWVGKMNNIRSAVSELVMSELIFY